METEFIKQKLSEKGMKITPQRMAVLEAIYQLKNHPTADNVIEFIRKTHPNVAVGTVYKVLETLVQNGIIKKVTTDKDYMRYDGIVENHHHLYGTDSNIIEDYRDPDLDLLLQNYFDSKNIPGFKIAEFVLQIKGTFSK